MEQLAVFRRELLAWFDTYQRDLPWRRSRDPYAIWLSEIMLQQTRVAAVIPYFERFLARFPHIQALAGAPEGDLLAHWAGLGYYYRARNLQKAAQAMVASGGFPTSHETILTLPGIGDYTAAAIASIAFNMPFAALDGNVFRVLSRLFADATNVASGLGKKHFAALADKVLDREHPGAFNQAMMELGATVCLPKSPRCLLCPVASHCMARAQNQASDFPVKIVSRSSLKQERIVYWIQKADSILVWQRPADSRLMPGFWELPEQEQVPNVLPGPALGIFKHGITIHNYTFRILRAEPPTSIGVCIWKPLEQMNSLPVSTIFRKARRVLVNQSKTAHVKVAVSR